MRSMRQCICHSDKLCNIESAFIVGNVYTYTHLGNNYIELYGAFKNTTAGVCTIETYMFDEYLTDISEHRQAQISKLLEA